MGCFLPLFVATERLICDKKGDWAPFLSEGWRMERSLDYARDDSGAGDDMQSISLLVRRSRRCGRAGGR